MYQCPLLLPFLIILTLNQNLCEINVINPKDVRVFINAPTAKSVTPTVQSETQFPNQNQNLKQKLLWAKKRSSSVDSLDMEKWLSTGVPNVEFSVLSSPSNCCSSYDKIIKSSNDNIIRFVFLDLNLWPGSSLKILEADEAYLEPHSKPTMAQSKANVLHISIEQPKSPSGLEYQEKPGFTALYWEMPANNGKWKRRPYSQCPVVNQAMFGGKVIMDSAPVSPELYIYDCIWVVRQPSTGWSVYVRITEMEIHGLVEVRDGIHSTSPLIATNGNSSRLASLKQPDIGFWGSKHGGIYLRVIKPVDEGYLTFIYGVAKMWTTENEDCAFRYRGYELMEGWNCHQPTVCIPANHTCNGVNNCPFGQDEEHIHCKPGKAGMECKHAYEKRCWSGECVHRLLEFCPEDPCPRDRPFRCDWFTKCYSQLEKCNGLVYCDDGKDERGCPKASKGLSTKTIVIIVCVSGLFTILPSIILCCWDDPVERDLQRAQEAFTNLCDLYSGRTLLNQIQAARRAGTLGVEQEPHSNNHRPTFPSGTNQEEIILLNPQDHTDTQPQTHPAERSQLTVPVTEASSPRRPPRSLPILSTQQENHDSSSTTPTRGSNSTPENSPPPNSVGHLSPPPYLLQPDVVAIENQIPQENQAHHPPPYLSPPGGATADGLPTDQDTPPPYESVQHKPPEQNKPHPPAYSE